MRSYRNRWHRGILESWGNPQACSVQPEIYGNDFSRLEYVTNITMATVRSYWSYTQWELEHKDVSAPTIMKHCPKTIQGLVECLKVCLIVTKIMLVKVIRDDPMVLSDPPGGHNTQQQELVERVPILTVGSASLTQTYRNDRPKVWELLSALTRDLEFWS